MSSPQAFQSKPWPWLAARGVAWAAGLFCLVLCILLIADFVRLRKLDPLNHPQLLELREQWGASDGSDEALLTQVRTLDLMARRAYFTNQDQRRLGGWMLLGGMVTLFVALKLSVLWRPQLPEVKTGPVPDTLAVAAQLRQVFAGIGIFLVVLTLFFSFTVQSDLTDLLSAREEDAPAPRPLPDNGSPAGPEFHTMEELHAHWPGLRGPGGLGITRAGNPPTAWDGETGEGILWKAEIPLPGFNSPVVWGDQVFLSGADEEQLQIYGFQVATGDLTWTYTLEPFEGSPAERPDVTEDTGFAAATMAVDGYRVFALFATGDLACCDLDGNLLWGKNLGVPDNPYGHGTSLLTDGCRLFVQYDHENEPRVLALDNATGDELWRDTEREAFSWATPVLADTPHGTQLVVNGAKMVDAFDPATGQRLWSCDCLGGEVAPSPAYANGIVFAANEYAQATALRVTATGVEPIWEYDELLPEISSPLLTEKYAYIFTTGAEGVCLDAVTGETLWEAEFEDLFSSSPILIGDLIYVTDQSGITYIIEMGPEYKLVASPSMGEPIFATPAVAGDRLVVRTATHLVGLGAP